MVKLTITDNRISKRKLESVVNKCHKGRYSIRYKRGQIYIFFPDKDLTDEIVAKIARKLGMTIESKSFVRAVIGY